MIKVYFLISLILIAILVIMGVLIGINLDKSKYFNDIIMEEDKLLYPKLKFYIKKHTIFRFFSLFYAVIHYILNVISMVTSFITVYMVMLKSESLNLQIFFLLTSAISSNLLIGFRLDKIAGAYAQAMRILEEAILKITYEQPKEYYEELNDANAKAEQYLGDKFF